MRSELPDGWRKTTLGDVTEALAGFAFKSSDFTEDPGDARLLRGDNVAQGVLRWQNAKRIPDRIAASTARYRLEAGDVVLAMDRPWIDAGLKWARVHDADLPAFLVQRVLRLRAAEGVEQAYIGALISDPRFTNYVRSVQTGTAVPHISGRQVNAYPILLPPLAEQQRILFVLGASEERIAAARAVQRSSGEVLRALFLDLQRLAERKPLDTIATLVKGSMKPSERPDVRFEQFSIPAFDAGEVPEVTLGRSMASGKTPLPDRPVVLLSKLNPSTRRVWWPVRLGIGEAVCSPEFLVLHGRRDVPTTWIDAVLRFDSGFYNELLSGVSGTTGSRQRVLPKHVLQCSAPVPDEAMLDRWVATAAAVREASDSTIREGYRLARLRDALLPKLVSGQIRVPATADSEEAVETVLAEAEEHVNGDRAAWRTWQNPQPVDPERVL
jgi:type I restriction enzyme, S subunit